MSDDINVNMIADQLAKKVDLPDNKGQDGIDYVVEWKAPTTSDPTWYRVYKSGWIEQGGRADSTTGTLNVVNLPKEMKNTWFTINVTATQTATAATYNDNRLASIKHDAVTTKSFTYIVTSITGNSGVPVFWQVSGQGANQ